MLQFIFLKLVRFAGADKAFFLLFKILFSITPMLIKNVGIIQMGYAIYQLNGFLAKGLALKHLPAVILDRMNPVIVRDFIHVIYPYIEICLAKNSFLLKNFFRLYSGFFMIGLIRPFLTTILKYTSGLIFASLGITFNEVLSGISLLKDISDKILHIIPVIPFISDITNHLKNMIVNKDLGVPDIKTEANSNLSSILSITALIIIGASSLFILALAGDYFIPTFTRSIPGVETVLTSWYSLCDYVW